LHICKERNSFAYELWQALRIRKSKKVFSPIIKKYVLKQIKFVSNMVPFMNLIFTMQLRNKSANIYSQFLEIA